MSISSDKKNCYRPSASVIIAGKTETTENGHDYNVLLFKRTPQTSFAPEHCVFPGGALDFTDESVEWLQYFKDFGIAESELQRLIIIGENRPPLLAPQGTGCYDRFFKRSTIWARDISLRITALRETFEEVGVLLSRNRSNVNDQKLTYGHAQEDFDRQHWQRIVHDDAKQFLNLCRHLDVVPDLWCLQEWSVWRSPATALRKFETVFYFVAVDGNPNLLPEPSEVQLAMWHTPETLLRMFDESTIWLPNIIFYELSRLTNVRDLRKLFQFAKQRCRKHGTTLLMPVYYRCTDGMVGILPGDDAYPSNPDSTALESDQVNATILEFRKGIKNEHRFVHRNLHNIQVNINISIDGHLTPVRNVLTASKL